MFVPVEIISSLKTTVVEEEAELEERISYSDSNSSVEGEVGSSFASLVTQNNLFNISSSSMGSLDVLIPNDFTENA